MSTNTKIVLGVIGGLVLGVLVAPMWYNARTPFGFGPMMMGRGPMVGGDEENRFQAGAPWKEEPRMGEKMTRHFIEMMIPHHAVAVRMAELALQRAEHAELKDLAESIKQSQTAEIESMKNWYRAWYGEDAPAEWFGDGTDSMFFGGTMGRGMMGGSTLLTTSSMGMMPARHSLGDGGEMMDVDSDSMKELENAKPFDKAFIEMMIPHHQMAVMMVQMMLRGTSRDEMRELGKAIVKAQSEEIKTMQEWYRAWYGADENQ